MLVIIVRDERIDDGDVLGQFADNVERQQRMAQVVEHAKEQNIVEGSQSTLAQFINLGNLVLHARIQFAMGVAEIFLFDIVDSDHGRSTPLRFERKPAIPLLADLSGKRVLDIGTWEFSPAPPQLFELDEARRDVAIGESNAVIPPSFVEFAAKILAFTFF